MIQRTRGERISVSGLCFPSMPVGDVVSTVAGLGAGSTTLQLGRIGERDLPSVAEGCRRAGVAVAATIGSLAVDVSSSAAAAGDRARIMRNVDATAMLGCPVMYGVVGRRHDADWATSARRYAEAVRDAVDYAGQRGVTLAIEPSNWLYADVSFVHTLRDGLELALMSGMSLCLDLFHVWAEGALRSVIAEHTDRIALVQLSDLVFGDRGLPAREVPGDGDVPLAVMLEWLLEAGYSGVFDIELNGPRIDARGAVVAADRAAGWLDRTLGALLGA